MLPSIYFQAIHKINFSISAISSTWTHFYPINCSEKEEHTHIRITQIWFANILKLDIHKIMKYSFLWKMCAVAVKKKSFRAVNERSSKWEHSLSDFLNREVVCSLCLCSVNSLGHSLLFFNSTWPVLINQEHRRASVLDKTPGVQENKTAKHLGSLCFSRPVALNHIWSTTNLLF